MMSCLGLAVVVKSKWETGYSADNRSASLPRVVNEILHVKQNHPWHQKRSLLSFTYRLSSYTRIDGQIFPPRTCSRELAQDMRPLLQRKRGSAREWGGVQSGLRPRCLGASVVWHMGTSYPHLGLRRPGFSSPPDTSHLHDWGLFSLNFVIYIQ